jgi:LacI family transcriptional regulator
MAAKSKVTTKMIADYIGMSQSTVSMILSNKPYVSFSPKTREKVLKAAEELGYQKRKKTAPKGNDVLNKTIMVICPLLSNGYYSMMIHSISERAQEYGYHIFVAPTMRDPAIEESYLNMFSTLNLYGAIYLYPPAMVEKANELSTKIPMVSVGDKAPSSRFDSVELDSKKPGYLLGEHLISLGHTHVTYISSPINPKEIGRIYRLEGIKNAFRDHGYTDNHVELITSDWKTYYGHPANALEYSNGYSLTMQALNNGSRSTAFVGNNDSTAFGIMGALKDQGYRIPHDYSVCGFDNIALSAMPQISLTTIEHASELKGQEAVDLIHRKNIMRKKSGESKYNYIMRLEYEPELIIRSSTGKCRRR